MTSRDTREKSDVGERPYRGSIVISNLPNPKMAKLLEEFDLTGSGTVNFEEISYAAYLFRESKRYVKWGSVAIGVMCFLLTLVVITQSCFILYIVDSYQIADATDGALVDRKSGKPLQVGSSVFEVSDTGILQTKGGKANVGVHADYDESKVSSNLSDEQLREMRRFDVRSSSGNYISMQVLSVARHSKSDSKCGTVVVIYTFIGDMTIDGEQLTFNERVAGAFQNAGFAIAPSRRRLMGAISLIGFFDMLVATTDYGECPSTYKDMMVDGSWYTTTEIYRFCDMFSCLSTPYDYKEFPMVDTKQMYPTNDASLAVINGKAAVKSKNFGWSEGVVDVDGEKYFKYTEHAYGEGIDNVFTSIEMKNFPNQRMNEVRNKTHLFTYNSWDDKNMYCHLQKDVALEKKKANQAVMNEKFNEVEVNANIANAPFSKSKEMVTIDGVVYNKWTYISKMEGDVTLKQVMFESYATGQPWRSELWQNGKLTTFSKYSFKAADGSSYGPADLIMDRKCVFKKDDANTYSEDFYLPFMMRHGVTKTVKPTDLWLAPVDDDESRRRLGGYVGECGQDVAFDFPGGFTYSTNAACKVDISVKQDVYGINVDGKVTIDGNKVRGHVDIGVKMDAAKEEAQANLALIEEEKTQLEHAMDILNKFNLHINIRDRAVQFGDATNPDSVALASRVRNVVAKLDFTTPDIEWMKTMPTGQKIGYWMHGGMNLIYFFHNKKPDPRSFDYAAGHYFSASYWFNAHVCFLWDCSWISQSGHLVPPEFYESRSNEYFTRINEGDEYCTLKKSEYKGLRGKGLPFYFKTTTC